MMRTIAEFLLGRKKEGDQKSHAELGSFRAVFAQPQLSEAEDAIVQSFSDLYYSKLDSGRGLYTIVLSWLGYELFKCPLDLWIYQEIIVRDKPDLIVEIGTYKGGSALFLANICDLVGVGEIVTVDINSIHQDNSSKASAN